jgi:hypothetical protein
MQQILHGANSRRRPSPNHAMQRVSRECKPINPQSSRADLAPSFFGCVTLLLSAVIAHMIYDRICGHVMATSAATIAGQNYRVQIRERCTDSLDEFILLHYILRSRNPDFEYWAELRQGLSIRVSSNRFRGDSFSADTVRIASVDERGVDVVFDRSTPEHLVWQRPPSHQ